MSYLFAFSYCSWGSQGKNSEVVCHSLLQWTTFWQTSPPLSVCFGWPHMAWLSFIELDKAVVLWSDWLAVCDCGFSLSALWCPLSVPTNLLGFLLPWMWGISYLGCGVSLHSCSSKAILFYILIISSGYECFWKHYLYRLLKGILLPKKHKTFLWLWGCCNSLEKQ